MQRTEPFFYKFRSHAKFLAKGPEVVTDQVTRTRVVREACSRFSGRVPVDGASGRGASPIPLGE